MNDLLRELRHAVRGFLRTPAFTVTAVLTLALGIGATTAMVALVNAVLLRPLPYPDAGRLVAIGHALPGVGIEDAGQSEGTYQHYRKHNRAFDQIGVYFENFVNLTTGGAQPERLRVALVTPSVLSMLGVAPQLGRLPTADDANRPDGGVLISHGLWVRRFGSDPAIVGRTIELNLTHAPDGARGLRAVVGVLPPGFDFPHPGTQVWYSGGAEASRARIRDLYLTGIARLRPGVSPAEGEADLRRLVPSLPEAYGDATPELLRSTGLTPVVRPLKEAVVGDAAATLWILLGGVALVLAVALANVTILFLARADHRRRETALRAALGAGRTRIARHVLGESTILAAFGGGLGLFIADAAIDLLIATAPGNIPRLHEVRLDASVLAIAAGITLLASLLFAAGPLLRHAVSSLTPSLKDVGQTPDRSRQRARGSLLASQMALALVLLIGSALMVQSLRRLHRVDLGFDPENVLTFEPAMTYAQYPRYRDAAGIQVRLLERLRSVPGVLAAEATSDLPLTDVPSFMNVEFAADGPTRPEQIGLLARFSFATPGYFEAMGIPLLGGRTFQPGDLRAEAPPVVLSDGFARSLFRGEDPIGRRMRRLEWPDEPAYTVVGVVADVTGGTLAGGPANRAYFPVLDDPVNPRFPFDPREGMNVVVRASGSPIALLSAIREIMAELDPRLPLARVRTMEQLVADSMARTRFTMLLLLIAAVTTLFLSAVGTYGVISYAVSRRRHEIGVRMALGARTAQVHRMVLRQGTTVAVAGLAFGIPAALALTRFLRALLFEVSPTDPTIFVAMSVVLLAVALLATYLPARRATRVNPVEALRHD